MTEELIREEGELPLALIIDRMAGDGPRGEEFVRRFSDWFLSRAGYLSLDVLDALGLTDVVLTFRMKDHVTLVATGRRPDFPGEVTVHLGESDLPFVNVVISSEPRLESYEICTLDYSVEGRPVAVLRGIPSLGLAAGDRGRAIVWATVAGRHEVRVRFTDLPRPVNLTADRLQWLDALDETRPVGENAP